MQESRIMPEIPELETDPILTCRRVQTPFVSALKRPILQEINLQIQPGEFVALLGLNGAGKSTLLRSLIGLAPIQQGEIQIQGVPLTPKSLPRLRQDVGMIFQGGGLIRQLTALENVLCGQLGERSHWSTLWGFNKSDRRKGLEILAQLGLKEQAYQKTGQLSGGQQQRVAIARALIRSPKILLADEPTTGLDVMAAQQVMDTLAHLHQDRGMTIIVVLHDLAIAAAYAQRAVILDSGRIIHDGDCSNLLSILKSA